LDATRVRNEFYDRPLGAREGVARHVSLSGGEEEGSGEAAQAFQSVAKGVSAVGKFAAKLGKKINKTAANVSKARDGI
jgi:hypothetical protein